MLEKPLHSGGEAGSSLTFKASLDYMPKTLPQKKEGKKRGGGEREETKEKKIPPPDSSNPAHCLESYYTNILNYVQLCKIATHKYNVKPSVVVLASNPSI